MKVIDLSQAKKGDKRRKIARDNLAKLPKQPKTIAALLKEIKAIKEYLGL